MNILDVAKLMQTYAEVYPTADVTFANNKVSVTKIVYDANTNSINLR